MSLPARPAEKNHKVTGVYPWGKGWPPPKGSGNFADQTLSAKKKDAYRVIDGYNDGYADTSPVRAFAANRFGLFDMGGNVWQWCEDWYCDSSQHDRVFARRLVCLRSANVVAVLAQSLCARPGSTDYIGFRCVMAGAP